jgi:NAD(P)-dependent dehydrogenase (short-subunit alcohol dehydrogenase family)
VNKVAVVTGATSWMAQATEKKLRQHGWTVVLCSHDEVDIENAQDVNGFFADVIKLYDHIDAVVNIAGYSPMNKPKFHEMDPHEFNRVMDINFGGVVNTTRAVLPHFMERKQGSIVSIISNGAYKGYPRMSAYSASKAAVNAFTKTIAQEYGEYNIRANTIIPGLTMNRRRLNKTEPTYAKPSPLGRVTSPEDVANAISFLLSDDASHVTGICLDVSGGSILH